MGEAKKKVIVACGSLEPELLALEPDPAETELRFEDQNLHRTPHLMAEVLQETIGEIAEYADPIVLGYGLCSNGIVGLSAPSQQLIIPRTHDCLGLFMGSHEAYVKAFRERPGSYYLTPGWLAEKKDPIGIMKHDYIPRVGPEEAESALREELKHYSHIVYIDTGARHPSGLRARARENAEFLDLEFMEMKGSMSLIRKLVFGPYEPPEFVIVEPGEKVKQDDFID